MLDQAHPEKECNAVLNLKSVNFWLGFSAALLILGAAFISPQGNMTDVATLHRFWVGAGIMGIGFALSWRLQQVPVVWFWGIAIATRLLLLPMTPGDDVWRYLWEGHIQNLGFSPYHVAPNAPELEPYRTIWWSQINHPEVSAIYPPITQLGFRILVAIAPNLYLFKIAFVLADLLVCWLLCRRFGAARSILYAWNPLVIYSFAGGAHYDSWFILPLVAAWLIVDREPSSRHLKDEFKSALWIGISIAVKWVSLPVLGFWVWRLFRQRKPWTATSIGLIGLLPMGLAALPFCQARSCPLIPTQSVFVSHGRSAEFIPHFTAWIWPASLQDNSIYLFPLALFLIWLMFRARGVQQFAESYWFGLLMLTPIIHFWYFTWIVPFAVATQNWGVRLVSLSAFVYFVLPSRNPDWRLTEFERLLLWLPFILGWLWTVRQNRTGKSGLCLRRFISFSGKI
jgi:alpha-1,6-mannosyltransferase